MPPGYDDDPGRRYPSVYVLQGYTGHVAMWANRSAFRLPFPEAADDAVRQRRRPALHRGLASTPGRRTVVRSSSTPRAPAATTHISATKWCPSSTPTTGRWPTPEHRGVQGKSSGGFGAMITPMLRPDLFGGMATHAGDAFYETAVHP